MLDSQPSLLNVLNRPNKVLNILCKFITLLFLGCENGEVLELDVKNPASLIFSIHASNSPVISLLSLGKFRINNITMIFCFNKDTVGTFYRKEVVGTTYVYTERGQCALYYTSPQSLK